MKIKRLILGLIIFDALVVLGVFAWNTWNSRIPTAPSQTFNAQRAMQDVTAQVTFGPRVPNSESHKQTIQYIQKELALAGWESNVLEQPINGHTAFNIMATRNTKEPVILFGAHFDSRLQADNDPNPANHNLPVPGANDGASGVAVLLEMARSLPDDGTPCALLFIDIEDNGNLPGWDWILGSTAFAANMPLQPKAVVIIDMIGDADLNIYMEKNSDAELTAQIWQTAKKLGYELTFISETRHSVLDDHIPFIRQGLPAVDIIDLDYPYWHTTQDTPDKVSAESLEKVGKTLLAWAQEYGQCLAQQNCNEK